MAKFRMDVDQKRYFCTLCSEGSITRAAQSLYLSRQGLSKSMKSLESQLGAPAFRPWQEGRRADGGGQDPSPLSARRGSAVGCVRCRYLFG